MHIQIQIARPDEAATVAAVLTEAAQWQTVDGRPFWSPTDIALERIQAHTDAGAYFIARDGDTVAAVVRLDLDDPLFWPEVEAGSTLYVHKLAVARVAAGRGVPKALLDFARERARQLGRPWLRLDCVADRAPLRALYEGYGFALHDVIHKGDRSFARYELALDR